MEYPDGFVEKNRRQGLCGVLATAVCAGVSMEVAKSHLKMALPPGRKRMSRSTSYEQRLAALKSLWCDVTELYIPSRLDPDGRAQTGRSVLGFAAYEAEPDTTYMIGIHCHVMSLRNGILIDQGASCNVAYHKHSRKQITSVVRINSSLESFEKPLDIGWKSY